MNDDNKLKWVSVTGLIALGILCVGAVLFFRERALFADAAYICFNIIQTGRLDIQEMRYGSFITQLYPLIAQKCHFPLQSILVGYSLCFNLFYFIANAVIVFCFRQYRLALLMALYYLLFVSASFYWTNSEIHQAVAWMFLFFGAVLWLGRRQAPLYVLLPVAALLGFLTIFTHFVAIIPLSFLWVYLWMEQKHWPFTRRLSWVLSVLLAGIVFAKYLLGGNGSYDSAHLHNITHISLPDIIASYGTQVVSFFLHRCITNYWAGTLLFIAGLAALAWQRRWRLFAFTLLMCAAYMTIMGITYRDYLDSEPSRYLYHIESEWASIAIIVAAPFVFTVLPLIKRRSIAITITAVIFIIRLVYIADARTQFTARTTFRENVLKYMRQKHITKLGINDDERMRAYILDWAVEDESLMTSDMEGDKPQLTFIFANGKPDFVMHELANPKVVGLSFSLNKVRELNGSRFMADSTQPYTIMTYDELTRK